MQDAVSRSAELQDGTWPRSRATRRTQRTPQSRSAAARPAGRGPRPKRRLGRARGPVVPQVRPSVGLTWGHRARQPKRYRLEIESEWTARDCELKMFGG